MHKAKVCVQNVRFKIYEMYMWHESGSHRKRKGERSEAREYFNERRNYAESK